MEQLDGSRIYLRILDVDDAEDLLDLIIKNKYFWSLSEPERDEKYYSLDTHIENIQLDLLSTHAGKSYSWGVFLKETGELIGDFSLYGVKSFPFYSASIGYSIDHDQLGKGYATEALRLAVAFAFQKLHLHRLEAGVFPGNLASIKVLEKLGFQREGLARKNILINGEWKDHFQYALLKSDWIIE
ncbi:GNAT family N-acetyltransferase [Peribacillus alkalitolerans]|uniref:GNAT family N-acetyltransferase n=1 Tax=Peribacillus alkalitolerans TaxID=1550385 RepID=UPI0013D42C01|nr:GNAT family protein [Peribacillus alkalitolerans]